MNLAQTIAGIKPGTELSVAVIKEWSDAIAKTASDAGYQTPASGGGAFGPLIPQSLGRMVTNIASTEQQIVFFNDIPKTDPGEIGQLVHEIARITDWGHDVDPFVSEGLIGTMDNLQLDRKSFRVRFMSEPREVTNALEAIGLVGANASAVNAENEAATRNLLKKTERACLTADATVNTLGFDGVITQVERMGSFKGLGANVSNLGGAIPDDTTFRKLATRLTQAPYYSFANMIYCAPEVHARAFEIAVSMTRKDAAYTGPLTLGADGEVYVTYPGGRALIKSVPFLSQQDRALDGSSFPAAYGETIPITPTFAGLGQQPTDTALGVGETSGFTGSAAGAYYYAVVGISNKGISTTATTNVVTVTKNQKVVMKMEAGSSAMYFRIYRTAVGKAVDSTYYYVGEVLNNTSGVTTFTDWNRAAVTSTQNSVRPGTSKILLATGDPAHYKFGQLLPYFRLELPSLTLTRRFSTNLWGMPIVIAPSKLWVVQDAGSAIDL